MFLLEIYGISTGYVRDMNGICFPNISRPSNPLYTDVSRGLREICSIFLSCSANEAKEEKGYKDSQVDRDEDAESEDCPPDGLPITIARKLLQGDNG